MLSLRSPLLTRSGFRHGFSLRKGGVSTAPFAALNLARGVGDRPEHVAENHARLARDIGYDGDRLYEISQVHGARVEEVDPAVAPLDFRLREADGLSCRLRASDDPGRGAAIGVRVADCVAVLLAHPATGSVAAAHAGWRGLVGGVLGATIAALAVPPEELLAAVFPHIGVDAFEVGADVATQIAASAPRDAAVIVRERDKPHADLARAVVAQLHAAGLLAEHVERIAGCTFSEPERFFSYRRDGAASGRHLAVIVAGC